MKNAKNYVIAALLVAVVAMSVGYAAFATTLNINGTATISGQWDVEIIGITSAFTGTATDKTAPAYTSTTATFDANLAAPGDAATYTITVKNKGTIKAKLSSIVLTPQAVADSTAAIIYTIVSQPNANDELAANETATVVIKAQYDSTITETPTTKTRTITGVLNYEQ